MDTRNFFVLSMAHPEDGILIYPMSSTGIPASKKWLAKASALRVRDKAGNLVQAPMWSRVWGLKVAYNKTPKGDYYQVVDTIDHGWVPEAFVPVAKESFRQAQEYYKDKDKISAAEDQVVEKVPF